MLKGDICEAQMRSLGIFEHTGRGEYIVARHR